jgi:hypothetical protein
LEVTKLLPKSCYLLFACNYRKVTKIGNKVTKVTQVGSILFLRVCART